MDLNAYLLFDGLATDACSLYTARSRCPRGKRIDESSSMVAMVITSSFHSRCSKWNESMGGMSEKKMRRRRLTLYTCVVIAVSFLFISDRLSYAWQRASPIKSINQSDLLRYANATWPRSRIPRLIHQTYRTHTIPEVWNATVHSVMTMNADQFRYRRWSHVEMEAFVRQYEAHFYWNTYIH